jgi:ABC-type branched-subunit amino acid transport system ATPase component
VAVEAAGFGALMLRLRGVYFSLLTLALPAMLSSIAYRWIEVAVGEDGLGGISRPSFFGIDFEAAETFYVLVALIGPNGAGKTTAFNVLSGMFPPDAGTVTLLGAPVTGLPAEELTRRGVGRSFQITNLFSSLSVEENIRLAVQACSPNAFDPWQSAPALGTVNAETAEILRVMGLAGVERAEAGALSYGGQRLLDMAVALATRPRVLLLDEPLAGLAAAERTRIAELIRAIAADIPVLLVEHDLDRVFQIADHVTVINDGRVLVDGTAEDARTSPEVQAVYIGSGAPALAERHRPSAARAQTLLALADLDVFYGKSHILRGVSFELRQNEIVALLGRNGAGKSTLLKSIIGVVPPARGTITLGGGAISGLPAAEVARRGVSYVPQGRGLFAGMSIKENMELGRLRRMTGNGVRWDEERIFSFFPRIRERWHSPADYLAGGEQQMVAVARAIYAAVGQVPILVKRKVEGSLLNRLQGALLTEAFRLVGEGVVSPEDCDRTVKDGLGLRWSSLGPFETIELNAPGGIADYCARYTGFYRRLSEDPAPPEVWDAPNTERILAQWRAPLTPAQHAAREAERDRRLAALHAHKAELETRPR